MEPNSICNIINNSFFLIPHKLNPSAKAYLGIEMKTYERLAIKFEPNDYNNLKRNMKFIKS